MAKVFYGVAGEGRGHAIRARVIVESLQHKHEIHLFAGDTAFDYLAPFYAEHPSVRIQRIPGLRFHYRSQRLAYSQTLVQGLKYLRRLPTSVRALVQEFEAHKPDLAITDFEPSLPRAARLVGAPFVSLDHQHIFAIGDFSELPAWLRLCAWGMGEFVKRFYSGQRESIVSSFFTPSLRPTNDLYTLVNVLLRPELLRTPPVTGKHIVAYLRRFAAPSLLQSLNELNVPVHIYGLGEQPAVGSLRFYPVEERRFLDDLGACRALLTTAGNQLVGEAMHLGKPIYAIPESRNYEQQINAHFVAKLNAGVWAHAEQTNVQTLRQFLDEHPTLEMKAPELDQSVQQAIAALDKHLTSVKRLPISNLPLVGLGSDAPAPRATSVETRRAPWLGVRLFGAWKALRANRSDRVGLPRFLTHTITFGCNAKCIMCDSWKLPVNGDLTLDEIVSVYRQLPIMDAVRLTGGEPFVRRDFAQIADAAQCLLRPLALHITSNGFLTDRIVRFCEQRSKQTQLHLLISVDGVGEKHNEVRGHATAWTSVVKTLEALAPRRRELNLRLAVNQTIVDAEGIDHYRRLRDFLQPLGIRNNVVLAYDVSATYSLDRDVDLTPREIGEFTTFGEFGDKQIEELVSEIERDLPSYPFLDRLAKRYYLHGIANRLLSRKGSPNPKCVALNSHLRIFPNGDVPTCQFNSRVIGNLRQQSFEEIWNSVQANQQRQWVRKCPGCWAECEVLPSALYTGDLLAKSLFGFPKVEAGRLEASPVIEETPALEPAGVD